MRLLLTANLAPFLHGGADYHIHGLFNALQRHGFAVELVRFPFKFSPLSDIRHLMGYCGGLELNSPNGMSIDRVISLQFPGYGIQHDDHWVWLMHQHRAVYELFDPDSADTELTRLRDEIVRYDNRTLQQARAVFTNSARVSERLLHYNGIRGEPLHHPPAFTKRFRCEEALPYVFYPSRLESLKRQELLIEAARYLRSPVKILLAGDGGQYARYRDMIREYGVDKQVLLMGRISEAEKIACYAHSLAVCFVPYDEDYGYITLEAMLSAKPVITTTDAGGPLAFVRHGRNGLVCEPDAQALATAIDKIHDNQKAGREMGCEGRTLYDELGISWSNVVEKLTAEVRE